MKKVKIMTDKELKALVASLSISQKETDRQLRETDRELKERFSETDREQKENAREWREKSSETDRLIKEIGKQIGGLGNMFGNFTEGLMMSSLETIMNEKFHLENTMKNFHTSKKGIEYDLIAYANTTINEVMIVEIKSHLSLDAIEQIKKQLAAFPSIFPEHHGKKLYGAIASIADKKELRHLVWDAGLYYFCMTNDLVKMHIPPKFAPKNWQI
jgi:hypothetical protein